MANKFKAVNAFSIYSVSYIKNILMRSLTSKFKFGIYYKITVLLNYIQAIHLNIYNVPNFVNF